jgi:hypothetical protein
LAVLPLYAKKGGGKDGKDGKDAKEPGGEEDGLPGGEVEAMSRRFGRGSDAVILDDFSGLRAVGPHSPGPSLPEGERGRRYKICFSYSFLSPWERRAGEVRASRARRCDRRRPI